MAPETHGFLTRSIESSASLHLAPSRELSTTECSLVALLTARAGELITKERVLEAVYPGDSSREFHRIEVVLNRLRQKARRQGISLPIRSVFGKGLVFAATCIHATPARGKHTIRPRID